MNKSQRIAQATAILDQADAEGRGLTEAEETEFNGLLKRLDVDNRTPATGTRQAVMPLAGEGGFMPSMDKPVSGSVEQRMAATATPGNLKAFTDPDAAYRSGKWLQATLLADPQAALWCKSNGVGVRSAMAGGIASAGGVLVPEELSGGIIRLVEQYGLFRRQSRVLPMSSDTLNIPRRTGGLTAYYTGENTAGTESDSAWDNVGLVAKKLMVLTRMSSEISEDAIISVADILAQEIALAFAYEEDRAGFTGTGISTDGGIVGALVKAIDGNHALAVVDAASAHDTLPEIDANDLVNLMAAIPVYARQGSAWYCSPTAEAVVFDAIKIAGGGNTAVDIAAGNTPRMLGYPIYSSDVFPDSVSANYNNAVMIAFGNLAQATTMGARRDIRLALSTEQYWEEDQIGVKGTERFDINVHDLGSATVKSPFAVLTGQT